MTIIIIISLIIIFLLVNLIFYISLKKVFSNKINRSSEIKISVVVAAKNEEKNIANLTDALLKQYYDKNLYEVIIIDDNSSDKTYETTSGLIKGIENFSVIKAVSKTFPGKKGALTKGIEKAANDYILITDADCLPERNWIKTYASVFSKGYDFAFGTAPLIAKSLPGGTGWVGFLSCFENIRSSILTFTAAITGIPYSAAARNFGFKKSSFVKIKGYSNTLETLSGDDDLLLREAVKLKMKIGLNTGIGSFVYSYPKGKLKDYLMQKARHTQTSLHYLPAHKFILGFWHLMNLFFLFSPLLIFIDSIFLSLFITKMFIDIIIVINLQKYFGYNFSPLQIFLLQIFYELFLIINFINAITGKNDWK